jgi:hypothetical protein
MSQGTWERRKTMPNESQLTSFPERKISEAFLRFAEPLLASLVPDATEHQMEEVLKLAFVVWNAVVYDTAVGDPQFLASLREAMSSEPPIAEAIEELVVRKRSLFADDHRLVGEYKLIRKDGELRLPQATELIDHGVRELPERCLPTPHPFPLPNPGNRLSSAARSPIPRCV